MTDEAEEVVVDPHPALVDKWTAEAEAFRGKAQEAIANAAKATQEAKTAEFSTLYAAQQVEQGRLSTRQLQIGVAEMERLEEQYLAHNRFHHLLTINNAISDRTVNDAISQLTEWDRLAPTCDIEIMLNSPGGDVIHGLALFDFIGMLRQKGHYVTTSTIGVAASMAGILLQAGDKRVMGAESSLLIHEVSFGAHGSMGAVEDQVAWLKNLSSRVLQIFADRCQATNAPKKLTKAQLKSKWSRTDWWMDSDTALDFGLVDEIR